MSKCGDYYNTEIHAYFFQLVMTIAAVSMNCATIPTPIMNEFRKFALRCLINIIEADTLLQKAECEEKMRPEIWAKKSSIQPSKINPKLIFDSISVMKFVFCIGLLDSNESDKESMIKLMKIISQPILTISTKMIHRTSTSHEFSWLIVDCIGFFRTLKNVTAIAGKKYACMLCGVNIVSQISKMFENMIKHRLSSEIFIQIPSKQASPKGREATHCDKDDVLSSDSEFLSDDEIEANFVQIDTDSSNKREKLAVSSICRKRLKLSSIEETDATQKAYEIEVDNFDIVLDSPHLMLCTSLLIILESTLDSIIRVTDSLLWYDGPKEDVVGAIVTEPHNALLCLSMMCSPILKNHRRLGEDSFFSILLQIILTGHTDAAFSTPYVVLGFSASSIIMNLLGAQNDMTEQECEYLLHVLHPEGSNDDSKSHKKQISRALKTRPHLRSKQIECATYCFREAGLIFHEKFDRTFFHLFIILPMTDVSNSLIRYSAIRALQTAIEHMSSQRLIFEEVLNVMPQIWAYTSYEEKDDSLHFRKLIEHIFHEKGEKFKETSIEHRSWIDIKKSFQFNAIQCISVIGSSTSENEISREIMFLIIDLARRNLAILAISFYWLEQIAMNRGFSTIEAMIFEEKEWFLQQWILQKKGYLTFRS